MNKTNFEYGSSIGANLLNVFRAPRLKEVNEMNTEIIKEQRLALSMAVLSQVHISNIEYQMALEEYETADRYYDVSRKITEQVRNAQKIARFGELELIREEASLLVAELRRDIAFSKVQFSVAQVYTSVGVDVTTRESLQIGTKEFAEIIKKNFKDTGKNFKAIVKKPINKQKPVVTNDDLNISSFEFAKNTFKLDGKGRVQYSAKLSNNAPLPEWITFLPSQRTFLIDRKNKGNIEEIDLTVSARNINTATEDTFTLVVDPDLRKERLAKEKRIKAKKLAEKKAKELKTFDLNERVTIKDGNQFTFFSTEEINDLIKNQEKKNKKLRKKLAKIKKKEEKERAKLEKKKNKKKKIKKEKVIKKTEPVLETPKEMVKSIVSTDPENYLNVYLKAEEKNGSNYKLYSDEEIAKFIKKQEKKNKKLRKKLDKIKKKEAKKKAKKLKISKLN
jgi:hypothetical protein